MSENQPTDLDALRAISVGLMDSEAAEIERLRAVLS